MQVRNYLFVRKKYIHLHKISCGYADLLTGPSDRFINLYKGCEEAKCKQGEGDCDSDDDCVEGLKCEDNWFGHDICVAGKTI